MNRDFVLKNFMTKLQEAKRQNVRDIRLSLREMEDLGFVIFELMSEFIDKNYDKIKNDDNKNDNLTIDGGEW